LFLTAPASSRQDPFVKEMTILYNTIRIVTETVPDFNSSCTLPQE